MKNEFKVKDEYIKLIIFLCLGVMLRFFVMAFGNNYDFDSYCIVGEISGNFRNVYAETFRYNYGPIFLCIQGLLYRISQLRPYCWVQLYRVLVVSVLTMADLGIAIYIAKKYSNVLAVLFFLNPISIIITGYHNQFDNIAVLFALISSQFFNEDKELNKKDIGFILFFSLSLITKHILFILPVFILLMKRLSIKKKIVYAFVPPIFFLMSFVPFSLMNKEALYGIINNVFLYRSFNNAPLLIHMYKLINFPSSPRIIVYGIMMIVVAWIVRKDQFERVLLIYFVAMVSFSSAIANQYLAIPMVALCVLNVGVWDKVYMVMVGLYLFLEGAGLNQLSIIQDKCPGTIFEVICSNFVQMGYTLAAWVLLISLIHIFIINRNNKSITKS